MLPGVTSSVRSPEGAWALRSGLLVAAAVAVVPTLVAAQVIAHPRSWSWGEVLGYCIPALGGVLGVGVGRWLKGPERRRAEWSVTRAVWTGQLPEGADAGEWRRLVRRHVTEATVVGVALLVLGVGGGALTAVAAATAHHGAPGLWALAGAQVVAAVALIVVCLRLARNGRRTLARLRAES
jgi:hypothetical protein